MSESLRVDNHGFREAKADASWLRPPKSVVHDRTLPHGDGGSVVSVSAPNKLYFGDNLDVLREKVKDESVDLVISIRRSIRASITTYFLRPAERHLKHKRRRLEIRGDGEKARACLMTT